jgi:hypothetical protein
MFDKEALYDSMLQFKQMTNTLKGENIKLKSRIKQYEVLRARISAIGRTIEKAKNFAGYHVANVKCWVS